MPADLETNRPFYAAISEVHVSELRLLLLTVNEDSQRYILKLRPHEILPCGCYRQSPVNVSAHLHIWFFNDFVSSRDKSSERRKSWGYAVS